MIEAEQRSEQLYAPKVVTALLSEFSAVTDYRTLRDSLPRRLAGLLKCRCILFYQRLGETLQFVSGSFDDKPGWSSALLAVAHINPINLNSDLPEASAWRERHIIAVPSAKPNLLAAPLIYRHRGIGVLVASHGSEQELSDEGGPLAEKNYWSDSDIQVMEAVAGVVALLLENTRLLERDRERIHELSLLNSISSQMNCSLYELERMRSIVIQRTKEISNTDLCELIELSAPADTVSWIPAQLREMLFQRFREQHTLSPLVIERPGDANNVYVHDYLNLLPANVKTFFAVPLLSNRTVGRRGGSLLRGSIGATHSVAQEPKVLGVVVGAYHRTWKLRREELVLLQVLASQASAVLENIHLMAEVVEARNEARKLLRQVLDDQRLKELILESIPSGLITTDRMGCITTFNRAAEAILGYHPYEVLGHPLHKFLDLHTTSRGNRSMQVPGFSLATALQYDVLQKVLLSGDAEGGTVVAVDRQGQELVLDIDVLPLYDDLGERIGMMATFIDVTSVHRLEEEKRRLDRLASLGEMAANVAHEVRNPLASIKTSMQMLMDDLIESEQATTRLSNVHDYEQVAWAQESVSVVLKEVERLDTIVRDLLLFAKPSQLHRIKCNVVELSDRVLQFIQPQCAEANVVVHRVCGDVPPAWIDRAQMEQVLLNLYMNAIQAMPDGGILTVSCQVVSAEASLSSGVGDGFFSTKSYKYEKRHEATPQQWLELSVSDTGIGIPSDQLERIFQPFFTTKAHGIGLGLAITRRLIEDHGGYIRVGSHFGYGATVAVRLPLAADSLVRVHDEENEGL